LAPTNEEGDNPTVGGGEGEIIQFAGPHPTPIGTSQGLRVTGQIAAMENVDGDAEMGVSVADGHHEGTDGDLDAQFFPYLTDETLLQRLPALPRAAWELP
jgi:hypothetical protein